MRGCRRSYFLGALCLVGTNGLALVVPWLLKLAVEALRRPAEAHHTPAWYGGAIVGVAALQGGVRIFSRTTLLHAARRIEYAIREELYAKLLSLDLPYFSGERTGDLMSRFANDLTNIRMLLGFGVLNVINTAVIYGAAFVLMGRISVVLTLCAVAPLPLMIYCVKGLTRRMYHHSKRAQEELARLTSQAEENISAAMVVRAYCREAAAVDAFREIGRSYQASNMAMARLRGVILPLMAATSALGTLVVLFLGGQRVIAGAMTLGDFVAFNGYLAMLVWPTVVFGWILNLVQRGAASMARLNEVLDARARVVEPADPAPVAALRGKIELRGLSFGYNGGEMLRGISLEIEPGQRVGIVGRVGSGKSTLVRLVARLFPVADGELFIDGIDINRIPLGVLRGAIGFVPQEGFLFSRTIRENIAYGKEGAAEVEVLAAARLARLDVDLQRFPDGYDTLVGERGVTLSGGQRQRAAIARALLKDPAILVLDDPLSAVDARTEEEILRELAGYYGTRTVLIVSHRLSAVRDCDVIVVLEGGAVAERGSHDELLWRGGGYAAMWEEQKIREEIAGFRDRRGTENVLEKEALQKGDDIL
ncbi:ABC transporter ATP-binding protein [Geobacter sp.]|uniref:ABC transporter ATP-binding protein n=1 Tax=Geobacter sp. TaxID=46610 RepID=UPI0026247971|nr:ABC transporter ATP-binding protein [Geobacter sp.]